MHPEDIIFNYTNNNPRHIINFVTSFHKYYIFHNWCLEIECTKIGLIEFIEECRMCMFFTMPRTTPEELQLITSSGLKIYVTIF